LNVFSFALTSARSAASPVSGIPCKG
jgi:hypothetical protein